MKRPPFQVEKCVSVAYVTGCYSPPGPRLGPRGFFGLYLSNIEGARLSFWTFRTNGSRLAYRAVSSNNDNAAVLDALIRAAISYDVPFDQWRPYPIGIAERRILRRLRVEKVYAEARCTLAEILHLARGSLYFSLDKFALKLGQDPKLVIKPMFAVRRRSPSSIRRDSKERDEIYRDIERDYRHKETKNPMKKIDKKG